MSRQPIADLNALAVSANSKETAINTEQTLDTSFVVGPGVIPKLKQAVDDNSGQATGYEEPTQLYTKGYTSELSLPFDMAEAQHFGCFLTYHLGTRSTSAYGTGYKHVITKSANRALSGFTLGDRLANNPALVKRRFASMYADTIKATLAKGSWAKLEVGPKGTGKFSDTVTKESITAAYNATTLTLAANAVQGSDAQARIDNVHQVRVLVPATGEWKEVSYSVVSDATPAVITISAPGGVATSTTYEVLYVPTEAAWCSFPARVIEPPLWVANLDVRIGGLWNGSTFLEGRSLGKDLKSIEWNSNRKMVIEQRPVTGFSGAYANFAEAGGIEQTLTIDKEMRDFVLNQRHKDLETMMVQATLIGAEFESGKNYGVTLLWPKVGVIEHDITVDGKVIMEKGNLKVMEHATYGSVRAEVVNKVAAYGA